MRRTHAILWARLAAVALLAGCAGDARTCRPGAASLDPGGGVVAPGPTTLAVDAPPGARLWVDGGGTPGWVDVPRDGQVEATLREGSSHAVLLEQCGEVTDSWTLAAEEAAGSGAAPALGATAWAADLLAPTRVFHDPPTAIPDVSLRELTGEASAFLLGFDAEGQAWVGFAELTAGSAWQHSCVSLASVPTAVEGATLTVGPATVVLTEEPDRRYDIEDFTLTATVQDGGEHGPVLRDVQLSLALDLRTLPGGNGTSTCVLLEALGSACAPCADQSADDPDPACLPLALEWPEVLPIPGVQVDPALLPEPQC